LIQKIATMLEVGDLKLE